MSARRGVVWENVLAYAIVIAIFIALAAVVFFIRVAITGGDVGCAFAQDPALCVAVKEMR